MGKFRKVCDSALKGDLRAEHHRTTHTIRFSKSGILARFFYCFLKVFHNTLRPRFYTAQSSKLDFKSHDYSCQDPILIPLRFRSALPKFHSGRTLIILRVPLYFSPSLWFHSRFAFKFTPQIPETSELLSILAGQ